MSSLSSYWIETMLTLPAPNSNEPTGLVQHVAVEHLYPIVPPFLETHFETVVPTTPALAASLRGFTAYALIFFRINFGYIVPGAFRLNIYASGTPGYTGTIQGYQLEEGLSYIYFETPDKSITFYITNLTPLNQFFQMSSQYLVVRTKEHWEVLTKYLKKMHFPYSLPEEDG